MIISLAFILVLAVPVIYAVFMPTTSWSSEKEEEEREALLNSEPVQPTYSYLHIGKRTVTNAEWDLQKRVQTLEKDLNFHTKAYLKAKGKAKNKSAVRSPFNPRQTVKGDSLEEVIKELSKECKNNCRGAYQTAEGWCCSCSRINNFLRG